MKQPQDKLIRSASDLPKKEDSDEQSELQTINRILDRRYQVLVELS